MVYLNLSREHYLTSVTLHTDSAAAGYTILPESENSEDASGRQESETDSPGRCRVGSLGVQVSHNVFVSDGCTSFLSCASHTRFRGARARILGAAAICLTEQ